MIETIATRYGPMLCFAADRVISRALRLYGEWAEHEVHLLSAHIRADGLVLDVGANIGTHTLAFARRHPAALVWGFEPQPQAAALAQVNCLVNRAGNASITQAACGSTHGGVMVAPAASVADNSGGYSLVQAAHGAIPVAWVPGQPVALPPPPSALVPVLPLDSLARPRRTCLLKIDVEGMEAAVLAGARQLIAEDRPAIFFEVVQTNGLAESLAILSALGYACHWLETHPFNRANWRGEEQNAWWRTEMGVLALPEPGRAPDLPEVTGVPEAAPHRLDSRAGIAVPVWQPE
ncbi:FkbM family methyltransferase [Falsiroseomonas selenitidurans]|uniref:FkbM family methyltransferase n=1 Tax=Falsiroseomonas selenitidurans TaxID=2716335 RepID=A0ABX1E0G9_9PROT|nr:FkbM family methyltransferase [Falsiroseomonas selenitidurans]NKC30588.1 FkbM family methyltransferase [Falsiroseomonas selenitidurans]